MGMLITLISSDLSLRKNLRSQLTKLIPDHQVVQETDSAEVARAMLSGFTPDVVLLDTCLNDGHAFALLDSLGAEFLPVVLLSDSLEMAVQAFRYNVVDFLLKPVQLDALQFALNKIQRNQAKAGNIRQFQLLLRGSQHRNSDKIVLNLSDSTHVLHLNETIRLESEGNYTTFFTTQGERIMATRPLGDFEHLTTNGSFFRVHQSHIVNLNFVKKVLKEDGGQIVLESGTKVPLARRRKEEFFRALGQ